MPATAEKVVVIEGMADLQRGFAFLNRDVGKEVRAAFGEAAEPIRSTAESLATSRIFNIGTAWPRMRVGVTRSSVYVAPVQRGRLSRANPGRYRRPNMAGLLLSRALEPALEANETLIEGRVLSALDGMFAKWERI
jgi:hypothetical protein